DGGPGAMHGFVGPPVTGEDVAVTPAIGGIDPALHRAGVHVWRQAERTVARLAPADAVGVAAFAVGVEMRGALAFPAPQPIEEGTRLGQFCALPRLDLRLRPVDAEDLGPARFELAEIAVERRICRTLAIVVGRQVFADRLVP